MKNIKDKLRLVIVVLCMIGSTGDADYPVEVEITAINENIKVAEPLILRLTYRFEKPQVSEERGEIYPSIGPKSSIQIMKNGEEILESTFLRRGDLYPQDTKGITYSGNFIIFYDSFKKKLIFDKPGIYTITVRRTTTTISNPLDITVEPASVSGKKMLSLLSDPNDFSFIEYGTQEYFKKRPERIAHLKKVIEKFEDMALAQMAAAHLGLKYIKQFQDEHVSFINYEEKRKKELLNGALFEQSHKYLSIGAKLSDEFPIREEVLKELGGAEYVKGNHGKAFSLLDELSAKYPLGEYGRKAPQWKEDLVESQKHELAQVSQPQVRNWSRVLLIILVVAVGVSIIGYPLLLKKKAHTKSK